MKNIFVEGIKQTNADLPRKFKAKSMLSTSTLSVFQQNKATSLQFDNKMHSTHFPGNSLHHKYYYQ